MRPISWGLISIAVIAPLPLAVLAAWPWWKKRQVVIGNAAGAAVIFVACLLFGGSEYVEAVRFRFECERMTEPCLPSRPSDFVRLAMFAGIAMLQVMALYLASWRMERKQHRAGYDREWQ